MKATFFKAAILVALTLFCAGISGAVTVDGLTYSVSNGVATLTGATSRNITSLTIPATITSGGKTYPVNKITYNAFHNYSSLRSVRIADSETYLGCQPYKYGGQIIYHSPFENCPIEEYYVGRNLAFGGPTSVQTDYFVIGSSADCVDITFGGHMTFIPARGFLFKGMDAGKLGSLTLEGELSNINSQTFKDAVNLKTLTLKPGSYSVLASMFPDGHVFDALNLERIYTSQLPFDARCVAFGNLWTEIPGSFLEGKKELQKVALPETITKIGIKAFGYCDLLSEINFPGSLKEIGGDAFKSCPELAEIHLNDGLEIIYYHAFEGCKGPERLVIPNTVSKVDYGAFAGNSNIKEIEILPSSLNEPITVGDRAFGVGSSDKLVLGRVVVHDAYNDPFKECSPKEIVFGEVWTEIPSNLFNGMTELKAVTLPETVEKIASMAFYECNSLATVNFPASLKEIEQMAFQGCTALSDIVLNDGLEIIDHDVFKGCTGPEKLVLPSSLKKVGASAFYGCGNIKEVEFLGSTDNPSITVESQAFGGATVDKLILGRVVVHDAYNDPFKECSPKEIVFGEAWTEIPSNLFNSMTELKAVTLPETVEKIALMAFYQCNALTTVNFPASLKEIGRMAFQGCTALSDIVLNDGLEIIGYEVFKDCAGPDRLVLPSSLKEVGASAFYGCGNVNEIEILPSADNSPLLLDTGSIGVGRFSTLKLNRLVKGLSGDYSNWLSECSPENVVFGEAWTDIPDIRLGGKESLKSLSFPSTLEHIATNTFMGCPAIERVESKAIVPPVCESDGQWFNYEVYSTAELYIPLGSREVYEKAVMWKNFANIKCEGAHLVTVVYDRELGAVVLNGADAARIDVEDGQPLEIAINPGEEILISQVTLDGRDITSELDGEGHYTVGAVTEPHELNVEFKKIPDGIDDVSGVGGEGIDFAKPFEIYRLDGVRVFKDLDALVPGCYILRQGALVGKISVK